VAADLVDDAEVQHECARQQDLKAAHEEGKKAFNAGHFEQVMIVRGLRAPCTV
jgi:hypothetical protein